MSHEIIGLLSLALSSKGGEGISPTALFEILGCATS
jgi:hypothetical protein